MMAGQESKLFERKEGEDAIYLQQINKGVYEELEKKKEPGIFQYQLPNGQPDVRIGTIYPERPPFNYTNIWDDLEFVGWVLFLILLFSYGVLVLFKIGSKKFDVSQLISEPDGKASLSRFQALIFTFVFMITFMLVVIKRGDFPPDIPWTVLALLGGSLATYLTSRFMTSKASDGVAWSAAASSGGLQRSVWYEPNLTVTGQTADIKLNSKQQSASVTLPIRPGPKGSNDSANYSVIAVLVGKGKVEVTLDPTLDIKGEVTLRFKEGNQTLVKAKPLTFENASSHEIAELSAAVFGDDASESVKIEIKQV